jgi:hydroxysqualene dehydroxylase
MKKGIVVGGGLAGLSASAFLADKGFRIELIEAAPKLGGRAYSFEDENFGCELDNGQHIMMGCYKSALEFMKLIGAYDNLSVQKNLSITFVGASGAEYKLESSWLPYPFNLLSAILNYKALSFRDRLNVVLFFAKFPFISGGSVQQFSVAEWLKNENQNDEIVKALWELISVSALNTNINKANAKMFLDILKKIFLRGNSSTLIVTPEYGLSKTYCQNASDFIQSKNGAVSVSEKVTEIKIENNSAAEVITNRRRITDFDFVISAAPLFAAEKFLPNIKEYISSYPALEYSSILSVHLKIINNPLKEKFYALIGSPVHWVFNHSDYITIVISDADLLIKNSNEDIISMVKGELKKYLKIETDTVTNSRIIKEKRATFIPSREIINTRPGYKTKLNNFFIAGDWTNTHLPSTIESAVASGKYISNYLVLKYS